jgi:hypothetical protein
MNAIPAKYNSFSASLVIIRVNIEYRNGSTNTTKKCDETLNTTWANLCRFCQLESQKKPGRLSVIVYVVGPSVVRDQDDWLFGVVQVTKCQMEKRFEY